jgi:tetratricopeptide (TPR) repeat protein
MSRIEKILSMFAALILALHLAGAFLPGSRAWGFHHYAFLPRPFLLFLVLPILALIPAISGPLTRLLSPLARGVESRRGVLVAAGSIVVLAVFFYLGRQRAFLLSDSELLIRSISRGFVHFTADTLAAMIQLWFHGFLRDFLGVESQTASFRVVAIASGIVWLAAMFATVGRLTVVGWERLLLGGLLATAGLTKLFYGYVETSGLLTAAIGVYIWTAVRFVQDGRGMVLATMAFVAAAAMHVTGLLLFPSYLYLVVRWARGGSRRWIAATAMLALPVGVYAGYWISRGANLDAAVAGYAPYFAEFIPLAGPLDARQAFTLFSVPRLTEFLNEQLYIAPFALLALVATAGMTFARDGFGSLHRFLVLVLLPFLALSLLFNRKLGGGRDWDLVANLAVPAIFLVGLALIRGAARHVQAARRPVTLPALTLLLVGASAAHLAGIILADATPARSLRNFESLFGEAACVSRFARSYAFEEIGQYHLGLNAPDVAAPWFQKAIDADPSNVKAIGTLGAWYSETGRQVEALPLLREAIRQRPDMALNHYNLATACVALEEWSAAAAGFTEAIRLDPRLVRAYDGLGLTYSRMGLAAAADSVARAGIALAPGLPGNAALFVTLGISRERQGHPVEAERAYREALALDADHRQALFNLGRLLVQGERWAEAAPPLRRLGQLDPHDAEAAVNLGVATMSIGEDAEAAEAFVRAIAGNPELPQAYINLALLHHGRGRNGEAIAVLERYAARNPDAAGALGVPAMISQLAALPP